MAVYKRALTRNQSPWHLDARLTASRTMNRFFSRGARVGLSLLSLSTPKKKKNYIQRHEDAIKKEVKGQVHSWCNQIPYHPAGQPSDWRIIKSQNFSHRSGS